MGEAVSHGKGHFIALSGGVGGAKLAYGLARVLPPEALTIVGNTGDDFVHMGLPISPDLDTLLYTLAGVNDPERGWGRADESWVLFDALQAIGAPGWFQLGDKDVAVHILRRAMLDDGLSLSAVTRALSERFGVAHPIVPMSDDRVQTIVETEDGDLAFQDYFVARRCQPRVSGFRFAGAETARFSPEFEAALVRDDLAGILLCPSNPFVSLGPILSLPGARARLSELAVPVVAVCPVVGGAALKGPTGKMMTELGLTVDPVSIVRLFGDFLDGLVVDDVDTGFLDGIAALSVRGMACPTVMRTSVDKVAVARACVEFVGQLASDRR